VLTIQEPWQFESIPIQLVIYSPHKPCFLRRGHFGNRTHFSGHVVGSTGTTIPKSRPTSRMLLGYPCGLLYQLQYSAWVRSIPGPNSNPTSQLQQVIVPAKCEACIQHDLRDDNGRSLIVTNKITTSQNPTRHLVISMIST